MTAPARCPSLSAGPLTENLLGARRLELAPASRSRLSAVTRPAARRAAHSLRRLRRTRGDDGLAALRTSTSHPPSVPAAHPPASGSRSRRGQSVAARSPRSSSRRRVDPSYPGAEANCSSSTAPPPSRRPTARQATRATHIGRPAEGGAMSCSAAIARSMSAGAMCSVRSTGGSGSVFSTRAPSGSVFWLASSRAVRSSLVLDTLNPGSSYHERGSPRRAPRRVRGLDKAAGYDRSRERSRQSPRTARLFVTRREDHLSQVRCATLGPSRRSGGSIPGTLRRVRVRCATWPERGDTLRSDVRRR